MVDFNDELLFVECEIEVCVVVVDVFDGLAKTTFECLDSVNAVMFLNEIGV